MNRSLIAAAFLAALPAGADELDAMMDQQGPEPVQATFKAIRVVEGHSVETSGKGVLDLVISHQFGPLSNGPDGGFGLDMATTRIGLDYGITSWLDVGLERSNNYGKPVDLWIKPRLLRQMPGGSPVSATWVSIGFLDTRRSDEYELTFERRLSSVHQLLVARKFGQRLSLQVAPTLVQRNLVPTESEDGLAWGVGLAGRWKLTNRLALTGEATPMFAGVGDHAIPAAAVGVDIETGGHVFQLRLSDSPWLSEDRLYTRTQEESGVSLGFNLTRAFALGKP